MSSRVAALKRELARAQVDLPKAEQSLKFATAEVKRKQLLHERMIKGLRILEDKGADLFKIVERELGVKGGKQNVVDSEKAVEDAAKKVRDLRTMIDNFPETIQRVEREEREAAARRAGQKKERKEEEDERERRRRQEQQQGRSRKRKANDTNTGSTRTAKSTGSNIILTKQPNISEWRAQVDSSFGSYKDMTVFPSPPVSFVCRSITCANDDHKLEACRCNIKAAFRSLPGLSLKKERVKWHPDRFSSCKEEKKEIWAEMAKEILVVLEGMMEEAGGS